MVLRTSCLDIVLTRDVLNLDIAKAVYELSCLFVVWDQVGLSHLVLSQQLIYDQFRVTKGPDSVDLHFLSHLKANYERMILGDVIRRGEAEGEGIRLKIVLRCDEH